jgi:uncharacterized membrane protein
MKPKVLTLAVVVLLICGGFALRLYRINVVPLRGDEAFTVLNWMCQPFSQTLATIATSDPQPPLAYLTYRVYALLVGSDEYRVRFLPALLNILGIPVLYALGKRFGGRRLGLLAALLYAVNPNEIWHAQDARNYAIWAALSPTALWLALRALGRRRLVDWVLYVGMAVVTLYFYYLELFVVFVLNLYVFIVHRRDRPLLLQWLGSQTAIAVAIIPWYLQERLLTGSGYGGTGSRFDLALWFTELLPTLTFGEVTSQMLGHLPALTMWALIGVLVFALALGWWRLWRRQRREALLLGLLGTMPLLLLGIVSLKLNVFVPRYVLSVTPIYMIFLASLLLYLWLCRGKWWFRGTFLVSGVVLLAVVASSLTSYYFVHDYAKSPDWRALASYLHLHTSPDDLVLNTSADEAFTLYHDDYSVNGDQFRMPASSDQPIDEIQQLLAENQLTRHSIWIAAQTLSSWSNAGIVEAWLADHMQLVRQTNVNGLRAEQYMNWEVAPIEQPPLAVFGDIVELADAQVLLPPEPTGTLTVWLYWRPLTTSPTPLKVFVHLLGDINPATGTPLWAQDDHFPQDGRINTTNWQISTLYRDVYSLPLNSVPSGEYSVAAGLYEPETEIRLPVDQSDNFIIDNIYLPVS